MVVHSIRSFTKMLMFVIDLNVQNKLKKKLVNVLPTFGEKMQQAPTFFVTY